MTYTIQNNKESFLLIVICLFIFLSLSFVIIKNHKPTVFFVNLFEQYRHHTKESIIISNEPKENLTLESEDNNEIIIGKLNYCFEQLLSHKKISLEQIEKIKNLVNNYYEIPNIANLNAEINIANENSIKEVKIQLDDFRYISLTNNGNDSNLVKNLNYKLDKVINAEPLTASNNGQIYFKKKDQNKSAEKLKFNKYTIIEKELKGNQDLRINLVNYGLSNKMLSDLQFSTSKDPLKFTALLETNIVDSKKVTELLYFSVGTKQYKKKYYLHKKNNQKFYYDEKGIGSGSKNLLIEPIKGSYRISGHFGMRKHPILRYTRMHTGVDMAITHGHPIKAAGDGTVSFVGIKGGYGKYIVINHAMGYKTAYGHLANFAKGLRSGKTIKQGDIIGTVGMTGLASGPHLHYELIKNNQFIQPLCLSPKLSEKLSFSEFREFKRNIIKVENELKRQINKTIIT